MATYGRTTRQGLPRFLGGDPWPPVVEVAAVEVTAPVAEAASAAAASNADASPAVSASEVAAPAVSEALGAAAVAPAAPTRALRRGLPRVPGGEPWPAAATAPAVAAAASPAVEAVSSAAPAPAVAAPAAAPAAVAASATAGGAALRRGLPRTPDGDPWPPAGFAPVRAERSVEAPTAEAVVAPTVAEPEAVPATPVTPAPAPAPVAASVAPRAAMPQPRRTAPLVASAPPVAEPWPKMYGPFSRAEWAATLVICGFGLLLAGTGVVVVVNWLLATAPMQEFLTTYPGEYHLPETAPVGIPAWLGWQHFFNVFLIVLIIRSGLQVRTQKRPTAFWTPRWNPKRKISLSLWFHQSLDLLWLVNGIVFVVLLFVTGQWMRIVPTSWEVVPNAISALLQYLSLDWPTGNGWVNYNSLQQLAYFTTVFIAAPLAVITGVRMSGLWPKNAKTLNRIYPVEWARAVHFPVMLYFVAFIVVHVGLVLATGVLRNLNHMYASQDTVSWLGFWIFVGSLVVIAIAWIAARPLVLAPIARLFGKVSGR